MPDPAPQLGSCENATCRKKPPAVIIASGQIREGAVMKTVSLRLCAECAGPLLHPVKVSMGTKRQ